MPIAQAEDNGNEGMILELRALRLEVQNLRAETRAVVTNTNETRKDTRYLKDRGIQLNNDTETPIYTVAI